MKENRLDYKIKIGLSKQINIRKGTLQTGNPAELDVVAYIETSDMYALEKTLHKYFSEHHYSGEWFNVSTDMLFNVLEQYRTAEKFPENYITTSEALNSIITTADTIEDMDNIVDSIHTNSENETDIFTLNDASFSTNPEVSQKQNTISNPPGSSSKTSPTYREINMFYKYICDTKPGWYDENEPVEIGKIEKAYKKYFPSKQITAAQVSKQLHRMFSTSKRSNGITYKQLVPLSELSIISK